MRDWDNTEGRPVIPRTKAPVVPWHCPLTSSGARLWLPPEGASGCGCFPAVLAWAVRYGVTEKLFSRPILEALPWCKSQLPALLESE